jgi:hypothetical protein
MICDVPVTHLCLEYNLFIGHRDLQIIYVFMILRQVVDITSFQLHDRIHRFGVLFNNENQSLTNHAK